MDIQFLLIVPFLLFHTSYSLVCPKCNLAKHVNVCGETSEVCKHGQNICVGTLNNWRISMGCGTLKTCAEDQAIDTTNCTGDHPYGPRDRCTVCCTERQCFSEMAKVQRGLDMVPNVIHCPLCQNELSAQNCLDNVTPCKKHHRTCEISKRHGRTTARCSVDTSCFHDAGIVPNKNYCYNSPDNCTVCCNNQDCIDYAFDLKKPPLTPVPTSLAVTGSVLTFRPYTKCVDQPLFPCFRAVGEACSDPDISIDMCPRTCAVCQGNSTLSGATPTATAHKTATTSTHISAKHPTTTKHTTTTKQPTTIHLTTAIRPTTTKHPTSKHPSTTKKHTSSTARAAGTTRTTTLVTTKSATQVTSRPYRISGIGCPNGWTQYDDSCYLINDKHNTFLQAAAFCLEKNGYLVELQTAQKQQNVKDLLAHNNNDGFWLGANDMLIEGMFVWDQTEKQFNYTNWHQGEPNSGVGEEDCVAMRRQHSYEWLDVPCSTSQFAAICETPVQKCT